LGGELDAALERARTDFAALMSGGADAVIVENFGDAPFCAGSVPPITVAAMTRVVLVLRAMDPSAQIGVNVLRNDAEAALSIAAATGCAFIRINVHTGAMITDQGWITGQARQTLLTRRSLGAPVNIAADVLVKHAVAPAPISLAQAAHDTWHRGHAEALIVSGTGTGQPTTRDDLLEVRKAVPEAPIWVGSGLTPATASDLPADVAIVGTWLHQEGQLSLPVDEDRVKAMRSALG
jgi:hypothetical protein